MIWLLKPDQPKATEFAPAMDQGTGILPGLPPVAGKPVHLSFDGGRLTSDAGILLLAAVEQRLGIADRLAACIEDRRDPERVLHGLAEMIRFRALLVAAGYPDGNDCDVLRSDPAFKMAVGRLPESGADLCSQPTISRLENLPGATALKRMMAAMVEFRVPAIARAGPLGDGHILRHRVATRGARLSRPYGIGPETPTLYPDRSQTRKSIAA